MKIEQHIFAVILDIISIVLIGENSSYFVSLGVFLFACANNLDNRNE